MEETDNKKKHHRGAFHTFFKSGNTLIVAGVAVLLILVVAVLVLPAEESSRTQTYKKVSGGAGLNVTISYACKEHCFDFNVYLLKENGQQTAVVRPDEKGRVRLALPEGKYVLLIGKQFGKDKLFPQEPVDLKNGQELELKLRYKEGVL